MQAIVSLNTSAVGTDPDPGINLIRSKNKLLPFEFITSNLNLKSPLYVVRGIVSLLQSDRVDGVKAPA